MKRGKATSEKNGQKSITLFVKTRTPQEAFNSLRLGHPIDVTAGYYQEDMNIGDDFWMMDNVTKLHRLAELRSQRDAAKKDILQREKYISELKAKAYEQAKQQAQSGAQSQIRSEISHGGEISKSG